MSYLEKLLQGVEVEQKALWEVTTWDKKFNAVDNHKQPKTLKYNHLLSNELKPLILKKGSVRILTTNETDLWTSDELAGSRLTNAEIVAIPWGGNVIVQYYNGKFLTGDNRIAVSNDKSYLDTKYLYYFLRNNIKLLSSFYRGSGIKHPSMSNILDIHIPIPPFNVQKKIVGILDTFTELITKLNTELTARKEQYEYYREQLFSFDEKDMEHLPMGDDRIGKFQRGKRFVKDDIIPEGVPCIHYGEMYTHYGTWANKSKSFLSEKLVEDKKLRIAENGDVVIVGAGETIEDLGKGTAWLGEKGVVIHDACFSYRSTLNPKYVAYFTRTKQYHNQIKKHISSGKISAIHANGLSKVLIPVPSPKEQERIVNILDKFDVLTTSISEGLPNEINLRKKQYEYYRDLLLTFPKGTSIA
ncbi:restriction endonuclease subunit S [Mucilaginibacter aquariorum]|uniref:Restriction endonuclease subunit S n=1 Tax=Mucilaginibacter aquariorum TaxID=2967225 RepID=A0ABT1SZY4_9SPHI|nr:restriction endonuclease subunit S [Mucilaginibacter aquariorum]MCQ6957621.1 restriction endonuclease subunit S [Mucilaginibacter aquariorum]